MPKKPAVLTPVKCTIQSLHGQKVFGSESGRIYYVDAAGELYLTAGDAVSDKAGVLAEDLPKWEASADFKVAKKKTAPAVSKTPEQVSAGPLAGDAAAPGSLPVPPPPPVTAKK